MTASPFGEHLKREREMRGVSLEEISAATRISARFLESLENGQWNRLPGGIFNRGFIRAVARFLGLDEESLVAEYALETNDRPEVANWGESPAPAWRGWMALALLVLIAVLAAGGWAAYHRYAPLLKSWHKQPAKAGATVTPNVAPPADPMQSPGETSPDASAVNSGTEATAAQSAPLELKVEAGKNVEVKVVADGKTVFSGELAAGESRKFLARDKFEVSANDSSAVLLEMAGQTVPPLGPVGQPGSVTLTRKDLKKAPGGRD